MMEVDYKKGLSVPTIRWTINEGDIESRRTKVELSKLYKDAYRQWKDRDFYKGAEFQPFATSPATTMIFRRFDNLLRPVDHLSPTNILVQCLLGVFEPIGYKYDNCSTILNDAWERNLIQRQEENVILESFLRQTLGLNEKIRRKQEKGCMIDVDVSDELKDLLKVYTDAEEHLKRKEAQALDTATIYMKQYINALDERKAVTKKLNDLKFKLDCAKADEEDCDCNEGDEE